MRKFVLAFVIVFLFLFSYYQINRFIKRSIFPVPSERVVPLFDNSELLVIETGNSKATGVLVNKGPKLVVMFHGNGSTINSEKYIADIFIKNGYSVLLIEYPGYGIASEYKVSEKSIYRDSLVIIDVVRKQHSYINENITLLGYSLGSAVAIDLSSRGIGSRNIIMSSFTSMDAMIAKETFWIVGKIFNTDKFDSIKKASKVNSPTLILHGSDDDFIPFSMSEELHSRIKNSRLMAINSNHHDSMYTDISENDWNTIFSFLE